MKRWQAARSMSWNWLSKPIGEPLSFLACFYYLLLMEKVDFCLIPSWLENRIGMRRVYITPLYEYERQGKSGASQLPKLEPSAFLQRQLSSPPSSRQRGSQARPAMDAPSEPLLRGWGVVFWKM